MNYIKIQIDDYGNLNVVDEDDSQVVNEAEILEAIRIKTTIMNIGRKIMQNEELGTDPAVIQNINALTENMFAEQEEFLDQNFSTLVRLAMKDTEDDWVTEDNQ